MFKRIWIMGLMVTAMQINSMDESMEVETAITTKDAPNFFTHLPLEVWDLIMQYLTFDDIESEEEFIERTKTMSTVKIGKELSPHKIESYHNNYSRTTWEVYGEELLVGYYPHINKTAIIQLRCNNPSLIIFAADTEQKLQEIPLIPKKYDYLIPFRNAAMFATHDSKFDENQYNRFELCCYEHTLTAINISTKQQQEFEVPGYFSLPEFDKYPSCIAFKKQGTHLIMHGIDHRTFHGSAEDASKDPIRHHIIVPLTIMPAPSVEKKKSLQYYFAQKGICKQIK